LSPEQARYRPLDQRADIYSLGLMMYEMLARKNPMYDPSVAQTINNQAIKPLPRLEREAIAERIRPEHRETMAEQIDQAHRLLREIISLLTAKEREDRAGDTAEVVELLQQAQRLVGQLTPYEIPIEEQTE
jgi:serine/threonine protein kinase